MENSHLRILTLNCWGLPDIVTKVVYRRYNNPTISGGRKWPKRTQRIASIAEKLDSYDVVCLQEVWIKEDQDLFSSICKEKGLQYSHVFSSGIIGSSGLQIISRYPIREVFFHRYRVNGSIIRLDHGDYHAGKGFGFARIAISDTQTISVIVTHTIARYCVEDDTYHADRLSQIWELVRFLQLTNQPNEPVFVVGDMNSRPDSVEYSMFTQVGKLVDAFDVSTSKAQSSQSITSMDEDPQRIDYIFFRKCNGWKLTDNRIVLNDNRILYSDHFGVAATFSYGPSVTASSRKELVSLSVNEREVTDEMSVGTGPLYKSSREALDACMDIIIRGTKSAQQRKNNHFVRCMISLCLIWLIVWAGFSAPFIAPVVMVAVAEFLIASFPVENEISALREVHKEVKYFL